MKCCANCFGDRGLREEIAFRSAELGPCDYCGAADQILIEPTALVDKFETVLNIYEEGEGGKSLVEWLRKDWLLFDHPRMDHANAQRLLADILDDGQIVRRSFLASTRYESDRFEQWEKLRKELMHENRFFPRTQIDFPRLEMLLSKLVVNPNDIPGNWFRARIQTGEAKLTVDEMKAPPAHVTSNGRANPAGIPYLYIASERGTAISEIRPHTGEIVCVADCSTPQGLGLVDLRSPRLTVSPFLLADSEEVGLMRFDLPFLERLGEELTRPVRPQIAAFDYTPSQYLCEFIKKCGYDGVIYRSSVSNGINLALFKPETAVIGQITQFLVNQVTLEFSPKENP